MHFSSNSSSSLQLYYQPCMQSTCTHLWMLIDEVFLPCSVSLQTKLFAYRAAASWVQTCSLKSVHHEDCFFPAVSVCNILSTWKSCCSNVWSITGKRQRQQPYMTRISSGFFSDTSWQKSQTEGLVSSYMSLTVKMCVKRNPSPFHLLFTHHFTHCIIWYD